MGISSFLNRECGRPEPEDIMVSGKKEPLTKNRTEEEFLAHGEDLSAKHEVYREQEVMGFPKEKAENAEIAAMGDPRKEMDEQRQREVAEQQFDQNFEENLKKFLVDFSNSDQIKEYMRKEQDNVRALVFTSWKPDNSSDIDTLTVNALQIQLDEFVPLIDQQDKIAA